MKESMDNWPTDGPDNPLENWRDQDLQLSLAKMLPDKVCGVYRFVHTHSGRNYVGSSRDVYKRAMNHLRESQRGSQKYFHKALVELGADSFVFEILEVCDPSVRLEREKFHINNLNSTFPNGFNLYADPTNGFDYHFSAAMRAKIGNANRNRVWTSESRLKASNNRKGIKLSPEHRAKLILILKRNPRKGKRFTFSEQHKANLAIAATGRKLSQETKNKLSKIQTAYHANRRATQGTT